MKYSILALTLIGMLFFACKEEDSASCKTCLLSDPIFGLDVSTEYCQDGDDVIVSFTTQGVTVDSTYMNTTVDEQVTLMEAVGATCE